MAIKIGAQQSWRDRLSDRGWKSSKTESGCTAVSNYCCDNHLAVNRSFTASLLDHSRAKRVNGLVKLSRTAVHKVGWLAVLLLVIGAYRSSSRGSKPYIAATKILNQSGGKYSIEGSGYEWSERVSLNIQNVPLQQPTGWHLGTTVAVNGRFSFETEDFHCVRVDDPRLREQYNKQKVIFVGTGLSSGRTASVMDTAGGVLMCP